MYDSLIYWQHKLETKKLSFDNLFPEVPLKNNSKILHLELGNCYGETIKSWAAFPDDYAVLGFLRHVFFPSAFLTWLLRKEMKEFIIPDTPTLDMLDFLSKADHCHYKSDIPEMIEQINQLDKMWSLDSASLSAELIIMSGEVSERWNNSLEIMFDYKIYFSPLAAGEAITNFYNENDMSDLSDFKKDYGLSIKEWHQAISNVEDNTFMQSKFINILNNRFKHFL